MYCSPLLARDGLGAVEAANSGLVGMPSYFMSSFYPAAETSGGSAEMMVPVDRALAASKNHREAEKRRRERIKSHLDHLRTLLSCDPKTDKASLLARAVEHVRDLKQRAAEITEAQLFPTEADEIVVVPAGSCGGRAGPVVFEASVCCDDRSDLLPELIETLRSLRMKTLRAEIATLGGRVRNVMLLTGETDVERVAEDGGFLKDALVALVNRSSGGSQPQDRSKRRRTMDP